MKKFFLLVAPAPVKATALPLFIAFILFALSMVGTENAENIIEASAILFLIIITFIPMISDGVVKTNVTVHEQKENEVILVHYPDKTGIYKNPVWGKFASTIIKLPSGWPRWIWKNELKKLKLNLIFKLDKNEVFIPTVLIFHFNDFFQAEDLVNMLNIKSPKNSEIKKIKFEDNIKNIFIPITDGPRCEEMKQFISEWQNKKISSNRLSQIITSQIEQPKGISLRIIVE